MPTKKPRINVTVDPNINETLTRMSALTGQSKSSLIAEWLEAIHPPLMRTVALLEAASDAPLQVKQGLVDTLEGLEQALVAATGEATSQLDWLTGALGADSGASQGHPKAPAKKPRKRAKSGLNPRSCNTGVRSGKTGHKGK